MSYRKVMQQLLQGCEEYIERICEQYHEIFQQKFQKYEDQLSTNFETTKSKDDEEKLEKYKKARDEHFDRIKEQFTERIGNVFFNEYLILPRTQEQIDGVCKTLFEHEIESFQNSKSIKAFQNNHDKIEKLKELLRNCEEEIKSENITIKEETTELVKQFSNLPKQILQDIENHLNSLKVPV